jgi:hypothetical protein
MLRSKTLLLFLLKAVVLYGLLSLPFSFYDVAYGNMYRKAAGAVFGKFRDGGFVIFSEGKEPAQTHINVGIYATMRPDGSCDTETADINTRYLGFIPMILLISLVLASPIPWKRKLIALIAGLILVAMLVMIKQWIALLWLCETNTWMQFPHYTGISKKLLTFANTFMSDSASTVLYFVVAIWLLVTFRVGDFTTQERQK